MLILWGQDSKAVRIQIANDEDNDDDDDDDDEDDADKLFLRLCRPTKSVYPCFLPGPLSEVLPNANLQHATRRI